MFDRCFLLQEEAVLVCVWENTGDLTKELKNLNLASTFVPNIRKS